MAFIDWVINPIGQLGDLINSGGSGNHQLSNVGSQLSDLGDSIEPIAKSLGDKLQELWNDYTGKTQIDMQNEYNRQMAEEEYQRNLQSIGDTAAAYEAAGLNRNLLYGGSNGSPVNYQAPSLQAYSGSKKIDTIMSRIGAVLKFLPAVYQASAAVEGIDQARERSLQSQIKSTSMIYDLYKKAHQVDELSFGKPYDLDVSFVHDKRSRNRLGLSNLLASPWHVSEREEYPAYQVAAYRNKLAGLEARSLHNDWLNWRSRDARRQFNLNSLYGEADRIMDLVGSSVSTIKNMITPGISIYNAKTARKLADKRYLYNYYY